MLTPDDSVLFSDLKKEVTTLLGEYISVWKIPFFGHHHNARAQYILECISLRALDLTDLFIISRNQIYLLNGEIILPSPRLRELIPDQRWRNKIINIDKNQDQNTIDEKKIIRFGSIMQYMLSRARITTANDFYSVNGL